MIRLTTPIEVIDEMDGQPYTVDAIAEADHDLRFNYFHHCGPHHDHYDGYLTGIDESLWWPCVFPEERFLPELEAIAARIFPLDGQDELPLSTAGL